MNKYLIDIEEKATLLHSIIVECEDIESLESLPDPEDDSDISDYAYGLPKLNESIKVISVREDDSHDYSEFEILDIIPYEEDWKWVG